MRDFGILKGPDLVPVLATLLQEGALAQPQLRVLKAVQQELGTQVELYFSADRCLHAQASDYAYRLEQLLYRKRLIERAQLEELQQLSKAQPERSVTQMLLEKQWVSEAELVQVVSHLTEIVAYEVLLWKETSFALNETRPPVGGLFGTGLPEDKLMAVRYFVDDAEKNLPVLVLMREKLGNPNTLLRRNKEVDRTQLSDYQYHVYRYVNNRYSIRELLQLSDLGYFETFAALYQLLSWNFIGLGQLDVPTYARSRTGTLAESPAAKAEVRPAPKSPTPRPTPPSIAAPTPPPVAVPNLSIPAADTSGQRQFLRRGRGSELLQVLVSVMKTGYADGRVIVDHQQQIIRAEFSLFKGSLVHVSTTAFNIRFGDLLVRRGVLGPGQLREALEEQKSHPNLHLGEILVRHGFVAEADIPLLVTHQMEAVIYEVLTWNDVKFYFDADNQIPQQEVYHKVSIKAPFEIQDGRLSRTDASSDYNVLEEADHNLPILLMMREKLSNFKAIPVRTPRPIGVLSDEQNVVLAGINGQASLQELLLATQLPYFTTLTALFQLLSTGVIELREGPESRTPARASRNLVSPPQRQHSETPAQPLPTTGAKSEPAAEPEPLLDQELLALLEGVPPARYQELRWALKAVLLLVQAKA
ncbi:MAG: hypothetical protein CVV27_02145 [Candidatus Melainabacteria bacterium HGW-Melainabacteria-1]|nr:MAG: hypothetical protein CVV27_02145 [Candidatus Melainabacteria bacterium HGW-Melainabacteria-1]